jgi:hypothetical protein
MAAPLFLCVVDVGFTIEHTPRPRIPEVDTGVAAAA